MKNIQKGFTPIVLIIMLVFVISGGIFYFYLNKNTEQTKLQNDVSPVEGKSLYLGIQINNDEFSLKEVDLLLNESPNYLPGKYDFVAKIFSSNDELLGEYGFDDPRIIFGEMGYDGPNFVDNQNFNLIIPYFNQGANVQIIDNKIDKVVLSIDISVLLDKSN